MGVKLIKIAVIYFFIGLLFGLYMSATHVFKLATIHVHVNLLGWMSLAIIGLIYVHFPKLEKTVAAKVHFWLHNIGLPIMMIGIACAILGVSPIFFPIATVGGALTVLGVFFFGYNILWNLRT